MMCKKYRYIVKTMLFKGFAGCVGERKRYQQTIKHNTKIHTQIDEQSMQNLGSKMLCNKYGRRAKIDLNFV